MQTTTKVLLTAAVLSLTCIFHVFDMNDSRAEMAETFVRKDSRVLEATGPIKAVYLLPLVTSLGKGDHNRLFFYVIGEAGGRLVQIANQDGYSGRVRRYCISNAGCFQAGLD